MEVDSPDAHDFHRNRADLPSSRKIIMQPTELNEPISEDPLPPSAARQIKDGGEALRRSLHQVKPLVLPSLLACDFANVEREIRKVEEAGGLMLHLDIMDGHFVPNISFGLPVVAAIRKVTDLPLDVHLMLSEPAKYIRRFREAGADLLTIHIEAVPDPRECLQEIRDLGALAGLSLNPPTDLAMLEPYIDLCDQVLVMSVMAGFGGQEFDPVALTKLRRLRQLGGDRLLLSVDGGINRETVGSVAAAGADMYVTGSAYFSEDDYGRFNSELIQLAIADRET